MKIFCIRCKQYTNHDILNERKHYYCPENTPRMQIDFAEGTWQILQCRGCEEITFRERWINSEDFNPITGGLEESVNLYPQRGEDILPIKHFFNTPQNLRQIYRELIDCFNNGSYTLCAAGLRALIEGLCAEENILSGPITIIKKDGTKVIKKKKTLQGKIEGLCKKGLLTRNLTDTLHECRFLGNKALHQLDIPSKEELKLAIEIIEHTIENVYEISRKAESLKRRMGPRKK